MIRYINVPKGHVKNVVEKAVIVRQVNFVVSFHFALYRHIYIW